MVKIGVISNPLSERNKRGLAKVEKLLARHPDIVHRRLDRFEQLGDAVAAFKQAQVEVIVINGGDGTVQATLTELFKGGLSEKAPTLAVLSSGMTNMIAADAGIGGAPARGLKRVIACVDRGELSRRVVSRQVMRMEFGSEKGPVFGMFFGAAGIYRAIQVCREKIHSRGVRSSAAVGLTIAGLVANWLLPWRENASVFSGDPMVADLDGNETLERPFFLLMVTTLDRLMLGIRPFWGWRRGALRFTAVTYPPEHFVLSLPRLLYGGRERNLPENCYLSRSADMVTLNLDSPFTLDGELYQPTPGRPVEISGAGLVRLIKL
jgi:hypothetical protein